MTQCPKSSPLPLERARGLRVKSRCTTTVAAYAVMLSSVSPLACAETAALKGRQSPAIETAHAEKSRKPTALPEQTKSGTLAAAYCDALREPAMEARFAFQAAHLATLAQQVDERVARMEVKSGELKEWLAKRQAFIDHATEHLVGIFAAMRAEAASGLLARLDTGTAAAILSKLEPRAASSILSSMPAEKASRLTTILASVGRKTDPSGKP